MEPYKHITVSVAKHKGLQGALNMGCRIAATQPDYLVTSVAFIPQGKGVLVFVLAYNGLVTGEESPRGNGKDLGEPDEVIDPNSLENFGARSVEDTAEQ